MKIAAFIPIKKYSSRVPNKNFANLGGKPLYEYTFETVKKIRTVAPHIDFYVDTDYHHAPDIVGDVERNLASFVVAASQAGIQIIDRESGLERCHITGEDLLANHISRYPNYDVYCQLYITCPFQKPTSIFTALNQMLSSPEYDSAFLAYEHKTWFWYQDAPLNYKLGQLTQSQNSSPVIQETTGFYSIYKTAWEKTKSRIGLHPHIRMVPYIESIDIDTLEDLELANIVVRGIDSPTFLCNISS